MEHGMKLASNWSSILRGLLAYVVIMLSAIALVGWLLISQIYSTNHNAYHPVSNIYHANIKVIGMAAPQNGIVCKKFYRCQLDGREIILAIPARKTSRCPMQLKSNRIYDMDVIIFKDMPGIIRKIHREVK